MFILIGIIRIVQLLNGMVLWVFGIHRSMRLNLRGFT